MHRAAPGFDFLGDRYAHQPDICAGVHDHAVVRQGAHDGEELCQFRFDMRVSCFDQDIRLIGAMPVDDEFAVDRFKDGEVVDVVPHATDSAGSAVASSVIAARWEWPVLACASVARSPAMRPTTSDQSRPGWSCR